MHEENLQSLTCFRIKPGVKGSSYLFIEFRGHLTEKQLSLKAKNHKNYGTHHRCPEGKAIHNNENNLQELNNHLTSKSGRTARFSKIFWNIIMVGVL